MKEAAHDISGCNGSRRCRPSRLLAVLDGKINLGPSLGMAHRLRRIKAAVTDAGQDAKVKAHSRAGPAALE